MMQFCKFLLLKPAVIMWLWLTAAWLTGTPAQADDFNKDGVRGDSYCFPAKYAAKTIRAMANIPSEKKDIVAVNMKPKFRIYDGGDLPDRYYIIDQETSLDFTVTPNGDVTDFIDIVSQANQSADLCIDDPARAGLEYDDESLYFEMGLTPFYKNTSGRHDITDLKKGSKDGRFHYKKMIPSAIRFFMPDTRCLHIRYEAVDNIPQIFADVSGTLKPIKTEYYNEGYILHLDDLEKINADALIIQGGAYKLSPVPSIKTMKRFGIGLPRGAKAKLNAAK